MEEISNTDEIKSLFEMVFHNIQINLDPLIFVELSGKAALRIPSKIREPIFSNLLADSLALQEQELFFDQIDERIREKHAKIMILSLRAMVHILDSSFTKAKEYLLEAEPILKAMYGLEKMVYSTFFRSRALYHLKRAEYSDYYQNSLQYLAYTSASDLSDAEKLDISTNMAVAILVSQKIFNFSELVSLLHSRRSTNSPA